jgi:hypothetical protein
MNKKGWLKIVEAFVAILLIASVLILVLNRGEIENQDFSEKIYDAEISILREIQLNNTLREITLSIPVEDLPIEEDDENFPESVKDKVKKRTPNYLECKSKICKMDDPCYLDEYPLKNIYAQSVAITSTIEIYDPRQVKIFCWMR